MAVSSGSNAKLQVLVDEAKIAVEVWKGVNAFVSREEVARGVRESIVEPQGEAVKENVRKLRDKLREGSGFGRWVCAGEHWKVLRPAESESFLRVCPTSPKMMVLFKL